MDMQEVIKDLTKSDRLAIRGLLAGRYTKSYVNMMFAGKRTHTPFFKTAVLNYVESKKAIEKKLESLNE